MSQVDLSYILVSPGMACKQPSIGFHGLCHLLGLFPFFFQTEIRMCVQPLHLVGVQIIRPCLVADVCSVSKDSIIPRESYDALCSPVGKIRMLLHKPVNQRHHVIVAYRNCSVILHIFIANLAFIIQHKLCGITVSVHIVIITHIILRQDKRNFSRRKKDLSRSHISVLVSNSHIFDTDHNITLVIHSLSDLVKLIYGCHNLIVVAFFIITVK